MFETTGSFVTHVNYTELVIDQWKLVKEPTGCFMEFGHRPIFSLPFAIPF